jgi:hypothetical protein
LPTHARLRRLRWDAIDAAKLEVTQWKRLRVESDFHKLFLAENYLSTMNALLEILLDD